MPDLLRRAWHTLFPPPPSLGSLSCGCDPAKHLRIPCPWECGRVVCELHRDQLQHECPERWSM